jgi:hypothetical protein
MERRGEEEEKERRGRLGPDRCRVDKAAAGGGEAV